MAQVGLLERGDLQHMIRQSPDAFFQELGEDLKLVGEEIKPADFVDDRIDLLAIDKLGRSAILELKRGTHKLHLLQAIAYAGVYSTCAFAFGVVTLSITAKGKISASTQTLNALGAICGTAGVTPVTILGGFTIVGSSSNPQASGSGTFNGAVSTTGQVSTTLSGLITNP
jgi:hypothetical protein